MKTYGTLEHGAPRDGIAGPAAWRVRADPHVMVRIKRLFPRASPTRAGEIVISDTPETSRDLAWLIERYPMTASDEARAMLEQRSQQHRDTETQIQAILNGQLTYADLRAPACEEREYQMVAADFLLTTGRLLLCDDVGLGKSISSLLTLRDTRALPAIICCLTHLPAQWFREIEKALPWLLAHTVKSMTPYDPSKRRGIGRRPDVLIVPYSKLRGWGDYLAGEAATIIFDEAQELRTGTSQKYDAAGRIADGCDFRAGLTATPIYNYGGELWNVLNIIAPDVLGTYPEFAREWCGGANGFGSSKARVRDPAGLGIYLRDQGAMLRRTRADVGRELPPVIAIPHVVDCDADLLERVSGDVVSLADAILARDTSRTERFQAAGDLDWKLRHATGLAKSPYVADFVRLLLESEERIVLYGWHRDVYEQWRRRLADLHPVFYTGTESPTQKAASVDSFVNGDARVPIVSLRAGAGLDGLQGACKTVVFGELDWSPGIHVQCIGRVHRDGQKEPVAAYFLYTEDGSDPTIIDVLNVKRMQAEPVLDPDAPPIEAQAPEDRIRRLAGDVLARSRPATPTPPGQLPIA